MKYEVVRYPDLDTNEWLYVLYKVSKLSDGIKKRYLGAYQIKHRYATVQPLISDDLVKLFPSKSLAERYIKKQTTVVQLLEIVIK